MAQATRTLLLSSFSSFFVDPPQPMAVRRCPKKKQKKNLEKAQRYSRDIHSKKLPAESGGLIDSRLREKCARRLRWRDPVYII